MTEKSAQPGWIKGELINALTRIANAKTTTEPQSRSVDSSKIVEFQSLDKLDKAIRGIQSQIIHIDAEQHRVDIEAQSAVTAFETRFSEINDKRARMQADLRNLQLQLVEAVKRSGLMARIIESKEQQHGRHSDASRYAGTNEAWPPTRNPTADAARRETAGPPPQNSTDSRDKAQASVSSASADEL